MSIETQALRWADSIGFSAVECDHLAGDLSARRYFRLTSAERETRIAAFYPPELRDVCERFRATSALLAPLGIRLPRIDGVACSEGWMLLEDLGSETLFDCENLGWKRLAPFFQSAIDIIARLQRLDPAAVQPLSPSLDGALLRRELEMTRTAFFEPRTVHRQAQRRAFERLADTLCNELAAERAVACHRDFMARNLIPVGASELAVIDHQDLRLGPPFYDLASLMNDSLFPPPEIREPLCRQLFDQPEDRSSYHRAAAQRTLKAIGSFAAFSARGNRRYEPLVPKMLSLAIEHLGQLPEAGPELAVLLPTWSRMASG